MRALTMDEANWVSGGFLEENENSTDPYNMTAVLLNLGMTPSQVAAFLEGTGLLLGYAGTLMADPKTSLVAKQAVGAAIGRALVAVGVAATGAGIILSTLVPTPAN